MNWNLEGLKVTGKYMGDIDVTGTVTLSRVKYGGGVSHHVTLDAPLKLFSTERDSVILNHHEVTSVAESAR